MNCELRLSKKKKKKTVNLDRFWGKRLYKEKKTKVTSPIGNNAAAIIASICYVSIKFRNNAYTI